MQGADPSLQHEKRTQSRLIVDLRETSGENPRTRPSTRLRGGLGTGLCAPSSAATSMSLTPLPVAVAGRAWSPASAPQLASLLRATGRCRWRRYCPQHEWSGTAPRPAGITQHGPSNDSRSLAGTDDEQIPALRTAFRSNCLNGSGMNKIVRLRVATLHNIKRRNLHV